MAEGVYFEDFPEADGATWGKPPIVMSSLDGWVMPLAEMGEQRAWRGGRSKGELLIGTACWG